MSRLDVTWLKHTKNNEEREEVKKTIISNTYTLNLLKDIIQRELKEKEKDSSEDYSMPNWACYQADKNGYKRALRSFLHLLTIKED